MELYLQWKDLMKAGTELPFWQDFYVKFFQAFVEGDRWIQYLKGVGSTLMVTALSCAYCFAYRELFQSTNEFY